MRVACPAFGISETCYPYQTKHGAEYEELADHLIRLTHNQRNWGFGLCFLYLRNIKGGSWNHKRGAGQQEHPTSCIWTYNHERPNMALGGITPKQKLAAPYNLYFWRPSKTWGLPGNLLRQQLCLAKKTTA